MASIPHPGAYPSPKDPRDWLYRVVNKKTVDQIPVEEGIEEIPLIIHNQGDLPTCTGEAGAYLQMINQYFETGEMVDLSAMFLYKMNREIDGLPPETKGSTVKAAVETLRIRGICKEILFPSTIANYEKPLPNTKTLGRILRNAYQNRIIAYTKCLDLNDILVALSEKKPVIFSIYLLGNFYKARKGWVPPRVAGEKIGGHAMVAVRYNKEKKWIKVVQSWGRGGLTDNGYMYIPFDWFTSYVKSDFPMLMEAYTVIDYIPEEAERIPETLTVFKNQVNIELNGKTINDVNVPPLLFNELGVTLVHTGVMEKLFESITGKKAIITWDKDNNVLKINI
ncbi:MAG: C1 family peptidase [Bacillota bacterium]